MGRLGIRERRDKTWYDTNRVEPGRSVEFFDNKNIGDKFLTNMRVANSMAGDATYIVLVIGVRLIDKTREQEDLLLDHLHVELVIGDKTCYDALGPHLSMLRHVFLRSELERMERVSANPPSDYDSEWVRVARDKEWTSPSIRVGYHLARPLVIPTRMRFNVGVSASEQLPEVVNMRVHLFGLETRNGL